MKLVSFAGLPYTNTHMSWCGSQEKERRAPQLCRYSRTLPRWTQSSTCLKHASKANPLRVQDMAIQIGKTSPEMGPKSRLPTPRCCDQPPTLCWLRCTILLLDVWRLNHLLRWFSWRSRDTWGIKLGQTEVLFDPAMVTLARFRTVWGIEPGEDFTGWTKHFEEWKSLGYGMCS